jgi:hypothetical protein
VLDQFGRVGHLHAHDRMEIERNAVRWHMGEVDVERGRRGRNLVDAGRPCDDLGARFDCSVVDTAAAGKPWVVNSHTLLTRIN